MKKLIYFLLVFSYVVFGYSQSIEFKFKTTKDTVVYFENDDISQKENIKKNAEITINPYSDVLYKSWISGIDTVLLYDEKGFIPIALVTPQNSKNLLPENLITHDSKKRMKNLIPDYYLDILNSGDIELLEKYEKYFSASYVLSIGPFSADGVINYLSNCGIYFFSDNKILFKNIIKRSENTYECEGVGSGDWDPYHTDLDDFRWSSILKNTSEGIIEKFLLEIDGDYLKITNITQNRHIITLVYVNDLMMQELENLFRTNSCDLSCVTWPRHADGSCDYDNSSTTKPVAAQPSTNVSVNKTMSVTENLKLRSGEATSTQVLTVMSTGTKVKILELGKAETIDGINSNWVKVEVQGGAKDRDGKEIKAETVGWCYGGYLK